MKVDPILLFASIALALALGALLTMIRYKTAIARMVADQLDQELANRSSCMQRGVGSPDGSVVRD